MFHGLAFVYGGRYDDRYIRTPAGWRFLSMRFEPFMFLPFDQSWADPAHRKVDPHAGYLERDSAHNVTGAAPGADLAGTGVTDGSDDSR